MQKVWHLGYYTTHDLSWLMGPTFTETREGSLHFIKKSLKNVTAKNNNSTILFYCVYIFSRESRLLLLSLTPNPAVCQCWCSFLICTRCVNKLYPVRLCVCLCVCTTGSGNIEHIFIYIITFLSIVRFTLIQQHNILFVSHIPRKHLKKC